MKALTANRLCEARRGERGAALVTALLLSALLLAAGGTLILTTSITGTNAVDSTAEMQAYYAAEAGVARTLNVVRGNVESNPIGTRATFRNVVSSPNVWPATSGNLVNVANDGSSGFRVTSVIDPDDRDGSIRAANPTYKPDRLRIQVTGFGPRNSRKNMEVIVSRLTTNYIVTSTITLPNGTGNPINFNLGGSNVTAFSGVDAAGNPNPSISAFGVAGSDFNSTSNVINGCQPDGTNCSGSTPVVTPSTPMVLNSGNTPSFLQSVPGARSFLYGTGGMMNLAISEGRYFTSGAAAMSSPGGLGATNPNGVLTFVDGDFVLGPGSPTGQGTLVVTGTLTLDGNFNYNGVIMVLGTGRVLRSGGGTGSIYGALFVANFPRTGPDSDIFGVPTFDTSGGGTANIQYNSEEIEKAKNVGGHTVLGVREY
ncbi:MAG: hypothetical protein ABR555_12185 [Pyrinomonadaceae bacterium]